MIKMDNFQYFSIKSYVVDFILESPQQGDSNTHPKHTILWRTSDITGKNTGLL